jgi:hypothetical protein
MISRGRNPEAVVFVAVDGATVTAEPDTLGRVAVFRSAARRILRSSLDDEDLARGLVNLVRRGRTERFGEMICNAILTELTWSIDRYDVIAQQRLGDVMETAAQKLSAEGRQECPTCRSPLSNEVDWTHWRSRRVAAIREAEAREGAVA